MKIKINKIFQSSAYLVRFLFCKNKKSTCVADRSETNNTSASWKVRLESDLSAQQDEDDKTSSLADLYAEHYHRYFVSIRPIDNLDSKWTVH